MKLHDSPLKSSNEEEDEMAKLPPSQRKKLRQKQRKTEARNKKEAEEKLEVESNSVSVSKSAKRQVKAVDLDPHGENLLQVEDPLSEATKYLKLLQSNSAKSLETHILSFELNMRKQKILLAFQAVKQLLKLDKNNPDSHRCLIKFFHKISNLSTPVTDSEKLIWSVLEAERPDISQFNGRSLIEANRSFLEIHKGSLMHRVAAAEMMHMLEPDKKHEAIKLVEDSIKEMASTESIPCPVKEWEIQECFGPQNA